MQYPLMIARTACVLLVLFCAKSRAHEVDQYSPPVGRSMVDLGDYWNQLLYRVVVDGVRQANQEIEAAKNSWIPDPVGTRIEKIQSPGNLAKCVRSQLPSAMALIENLEHKIAETDARDIASGRLLAYRPDAAQSIYQPAARFRDLRYWNRLVFMRSSTIKVHGHYLGTDKVGHFFAMGYYYYGAFQAAQLMGHTHEESLQKASDICGWVTENSFLGMTSTAIYSNADMAANYSGLKFYLNLHQPVRLRGKIEPAMVVREGDFWRIRDGFRPDSSLFAKYISVHWDEVLNPCHMEESFREHTRQEIYARRDALLEWYAGADPRRRSKEYFDNILRHTETYYGENYGHSGAEAHELGIGTICFDPPTARNRVIVRGNRTHLPWGRTPNVD